MFPRFMMPVAVAGGAGVLFSLGIMFGLGLLAPPEKIQANGPSKYAQRTMGAIDQVKRIEDDRALTPIYPASPGGAVATEAASAKQEVTETVTAAKPAEPAAVPQQQAEANEERIVEPVTTAATPVQAAQPETASLPEPAPAPAVETTGSAQKERTPALAETAPVATPVSTRSANVCDVQACGRAYRSFRESDCTYQPYQGPRRICVNPWVSEPTQAAAPRQQRTRTSSRNRADELEDVADQVRRITGSRDVLYPPPSLRDRRMIAIDRW